jgi:chemotaxis family two-component system response regulator PixG
MLAVIEGNITEILFDIHQQWDQLRYRSALKLTYRPIPQDTNRFNIGLIRVDQAWQQAKQAWEAWQQAGFVDYSPNLAPTIWKPEELRQQTSPLAYYNLGRPSRWQSDFQGFSGQVETEPVACDPINHALHP